VIEVEVYKEGENIFLQPRTIVPLPVSRFEGVGKRSTSGVTRLWVADGQKWHLDKRCGPVTKGMLLKLDEIITNNLDVDGPRWNQKFYVAYRIGNYNWLTIVTHAKVLRLRVLVKKDTFKQPDLAKRLDVEEFDTEESFADKIGLPSSILVKQESDAKDRVVLRIKEGFGIESEKFINFLKEAYKSFVS
jgi:predicted transport protein